MTLNRHKSKLIPEVSLSGDGTIFVTEADGTFPLRRGKSRRSGIKNEAFEPDVESFHSYDPKRDKNKRRFKQRKSNRFGKEVANLSGTISTQSSHSLGRRLRRSKSARSPTKEKVENFDFKGGNSAGRRKIRGGSPKMDRDFAASLRTQKEEARMKKLSERSSSSDNSGQDKWKAKDMVLAQNSTPNGVAKSPLRSSRLDRNLSDEKLPYMVFLVAGPLLFLLGVARVVLLPWHEYHCSLWTASVVLFLGVIGKLHKAQYMDKCKTWCYIILGYAGTLCTLASTWLILSVAVPMLRLLLRDVPARDVLSMVTFSARENHSAAGVSLDDGTVTWVGVSWDWSSLVVTLVCFYCHTAAMMAFVNYYDAVYDITSECDHRGNPKFFNPLEQCSLGQATTFIGITVVIIVDELNKETFNHYYSPIWCGLLVILAGFVGICFGKRRDSRCRGALLLAVQLLAVCACATVTVVFNIGLVENVEKLISKDTEPLSGPEHNETLTCVIAVAILDLVILINIIFSVGVMYLTARHTCCQRVPPTRELNNNWSRI